MAIPPFEIPQVIILSYPRSGTHFLESALASHPQIRTRGECFLRYRRRLLDSAHPEHFFRPDSVVYTNSPDKVNIGILMYNVVEFFNEYCGSLTDYRIIHLLRNPRDAAISVLQMRANRAHYGNAYAVHYRIGQVVPPHCPYDVNEVELLEHQIAAEQAKFLLLLRDQQNVLELVYDALLSSHDCDDMPRNIAETILNFLDLPPMPLRTSLQRTGTFGGRR
jgi:hypothetical protein